MSVVNKSMATSAVPTLLH